MKLPRSLSLLPAALVLLVLVARIERSSGQLPSPEKPVPVGVATIDITPEKPIRMSGYGSRATPSEGVEQNLRAKAVRIGGGTEESPLSLLLTVDSIGVPRWVTDKVAARLEADLGVARENLAICSSHTHTGPSLKGSIPFMFPSGLSEEESATIDAYSEGLVEKLVEVAKEACADPVPGRLSWTKGTLGFAANRRVLENGKWKGFGVQEDGPVDHSFPLMKVASADGKLLAVVANYACHCTTLGGNFNRIHGDWAGVAQEEIERRHPGTTALIAIGCGADQNPEPRGELDMAVAHGKALADEVDRLLGETLTPLPAPRGKADDITIALDDPPARGVWEEQVREKQRGHHFAAAMLAKLDRGEELESEFPYLVQTWTFGEELAMVFLPGEVVVDYAHRFYREFDADRLWINAYANDVPCYIPSKRLLGEDGYEVDYSRVYYGKPGRLAFDTEDRISDEVLRQLPHGFYSEETRKLLPSPVEKEQALDTIRIADGWRVELVAAEPLVRDPVDIAWDGQGRLWVVEMADYPLGVDGKPGGRVRFLEDRDGDGFFDESTLFLDGLKHPNSVLPWRDGALVVVADRVLFSRDTDGDGRADETETLFSGFDSGNSQHQLGGLEWSLEGWLHAGNGGGKGSLVSTRSGRSVEIGSRDVRFRPDTGEVETISGATQYGLTRDDWGNWFACNNSKPWWHYALSDTRLRRNPFVAWPDAKVLLGDEPVASPVFPASRTTSRFNDYDAANRFTSACGLELFRDELPDSEAPCLFVAEPVHNLVSRVSLNPDGSTFSASRLPSESGSEFFASTDNWSRPTSVRTGPDGALYVVDMYRLVIEHPEWIPETWQRRLNLREGHDRGRIYRLLPEGGKADPPPVLADLSTVDLVAALDHRNGARRDLAHRELLWREDPESVAPLRELVQSSAHPEARAQALAALAGLDGLTHGILLLALRDEHPGVRQVAARLSAPHLDSGDGKLRAFVLAAARDDDPQVRREAAYALGESEDATAARALAELLGPGEADRFVRYAALSSALPHVDGLLSELAPRWAELPTETSTSLVRTLVGLEDTALLASFLDRLAASEKDLPLDRFALVTETLEKSGHSLAKLARAKDSPLMEKLAGLDPFFERARSLTDASDSSPEERAAAIRLLGGSREGIAPDLPRLLSLARAGQPAAIQVAAMTRGEGLGADSFAEGVLGNWNELGVAARDRYLEAALRRSAWTRRILEAAASRPEVARAFDPMQRAALLRHPHEETRERAGAVFASADTGTRSELLARYEPSLDREGDPERGRQHFAALCSSCHRMDGGGFHVGPDLAALTNKSGEALLVGILDPNRAVESKYAMYVAETKDGRSLSGVLASETASGVTLLGAGGLSETLLRDQLESLHSPGLSLMPEGLEAGLDEIAMADLLAYLQRTGTDSRVVPDSHGSIRLTAAKASLSGPHAHLDPGTGAVSDITREDSLTWSVTQLPAGDYAVFSDAALDSPEIAEPDSFSLAIGDRVLHGTVEKTGALNRLRKRQFGEIVIEEDAGETLLRFTQDLGKGRVAIREIALIPRR